MIQSCNSLYFAFFLFWNWFVLRIIKVDSSHFIRVCSVCHFNLIKLFSVMNRRRLWLCWLRPWCPSWARLRAFSSTVFQPAWVRYRRLHRDVVYHCWPIAPSYTSPMRGDGGVAGSQPMSTAVHIPWHGAQINFGDLRGTSIFKLWSGRKEHQGNSRAGE
jgi:hypothetical protein